MKNSEVLSIVNELIIEEGGRKVALNDPFSAADIDDLGQIVFFIALEEHFPIDLDTRHVPGLSVRDLVHLCRESLDVVQ